MNVFHITFGVSAYENLKRAFQQKSVCENDKIICINEDFSIGPLYKLASPKGNEERIISRANSRVHPGVGEMLSI